MFKRFMAAAFSLILVLSICVLSDKRVMNSETVASNTELSDRYTVIIDAGHGGLTNTTH